MGKFLLPTLPHWIWENKEAPAEGVGLKDGLWLWGYLSTCLLRSTVIRTVCNGIYSQESMDGLQVTAQIWHLPTGFGAYYLWNGCLLPWFPYWHTSNNLCILPGKGNSKELPYYTKRVDLLCLQLDTLSGLPLMDRTGTKSCGRPSSCTGSIFQAHSNYGTIKGHRQEM